MHESKLIKILKAFTRKEFSEFEKFAASPFHNDGRNYSALVKELKKHHPGFSGNNFSFEKIFDKLYKGKKYSDSLVHTSLSRILKMVQEYISYKAYKKNNLAASYNYIHELLNRELYTAAESQLKAYLKSADFSEGISDEMVRGRMDYEILNVQLSFRTDRSHAGNQSSLNQTDYHIR